MGRIDNCALTPLIDAEQRAVLSLARITYGETGQILVSLEELCELAAVCAKYPRYEDKEKAKEELHTKAVDEVADVLVVLDHIVNILELTPQEIRERISAKIARLNRWLSQSTSMEQTTVDREVTETKTQQDCGTCEFYGDPRNLMPGHICIQCADHKGAYYKSKES